MRIIRQFFQHYGHPLHVLCRVRDVADFFGVSFNLREAAGSFVFRKYEEFFKSMVY